MIVSPAQGGRNRSFNFKEGGDLDGIHIDGNTLDLFGSCLPENS